jgi:hypothetical protein
MVKCLPETATLNGPPSCEAKGQLPKYPNRALPLLGWGIDLPQVCT